MKRSIRADIAKIRQLAFRRMEKCGELLKRLYRNRSYIDRREDAGLIWNVYDWLSVPLTLWPVDFEGLAVHLLTVVEKKAAADPQLLMLLGLIGAPPNADAQRIVGDYEHDIAQGRYEKLVLQQAKFIELENQLANDPELLAAWHELKRHFKVERFQNHRGVIRRRMSQERNFREGWGFDWRSSKARFLVIFDALCYRWDLYGVEKDRPLLLKVSVNPTPTWHDDRHTAPLEFRQTARSKLARDWQTASRSRSLTAGTEVEHLSRAAHRGGVGSKTPF
jgi:hypothetical protein